MYDEYSAAGARLREQCRQELVGWALQYPWTHFVTLALNDPMARPELAKRRLRDWDARVNRFICGPKWQKRPDERLFTLAVLEKPHAHPHWHILVRLNADQLASRSLEIGEEFIRAWQQLVPGGDAHVRLVDNPRAALKYLVKELGAELQYSEMQIPRAFEAS